MKLSALKLSKRSVFLIGTLAFLAAFVWLLTTRGPLAPVGVEIATVTRADLSPAVYGIGTVEAQHDYAVGPIQAGRVLRVLVDQGDVGQGRPVAGRNRSGGLAPACRGGEQCDRAGTSDRTGGTGAGDRGGEPRAAGAGQQ